MNKPIALLTLAATLAIALPSQAATTYSFTGFFGETLPPGQSDYTATFDFTVPDHITADTTIAAASMMSCTTHASPCESVTFYMNAAAAGLAPDHPEWQAFGFSTATTTGYYYFDAPAFTVDGTYASYVNEGTLTISASAVPEPASTTLIGAGLSLLLAAAARRRASRRG